MFSIDPSNYKQSAAFGNRNMVFVSCEGFFPILIAESAILGLFPNVA